MAFNINKEDAKPKTHSQDFIPSFIRKTYDILEEARFPQYIDWNPEGTALVIKKPSEFSQKVLPIYFKHNNFTSFVRQLNMYDFHKKRTQGLDHVYIHELFQKGNRHLLQGIKRKTHEHTGEKIAKAPEVQQVSKAVPEDLSSLFKENQLIKHLYNEAMNRLAALERRAKELAAQNQTLMSQIYCQNENGAFKPNMVRGESQSELTEQLPMTLGKMTLNLTAGYKPQAPVTRLFTQPNTATYMKPSISPVSNVRSDLYREDSAVSASTEVSRGSPAVQSVIDNEEVFENYQSVPQRVEVYDQFSSFPKGFSNQAPALRIASELSISRQEMSAGQMIDSWTLDLGNDEMICFADQRVDRPTANMQSMYQDRSLLGKRPFEPSVDMGFYIAEPAMKRPELCISNRMGLISTGTEDQEGMDSNLYANNVMPAVGGYDQQMGIDSMEF